MEDFNYKMINTFNQNFICNNIKKIVELYEKNISLSRYFEGVNILEEKCKHPLFQNYNYCLFCGERAKTKYFLNNLYNMHMNLEEETMGQFLINNKIKLREVKNKKQKIAKRRFIKSYDNYEKKDKYYYNKLPVIPNNQSDTELYVYDNIQSKTLKKKRSKKIRNAKKGLNKEIKKSLSSDYQNKKIDKKLQKTECDNENIKHTNTKNINYMIKGIEQKVFSDNFDNLKKSNIDKDENTNINIDGENDKDTLDCIIEIKDSNDFINNKKKQILKKSKSKYAISKSKGKVFIESSSSSTESRLLSLDKDKDKEKMNTIIIIEEKKSSIDNEVPKKSNKIKESFNEVKRFLSGRRLSLTKNLRKRSASNNFEMLENNNAFNRNHTLKESKLAHKNSNNVLEKNDNCTICMSEIREKYTLICGDFFCRECIKDTILTAMKEISNLDRLSCPTCNELIEENTIKKLLSEEEFNKYQTLMIKITGLKNKDKDLIPCPYPDCPGWARENQSNNNIVMCQYEHTFCKKCQSVLDINLRQNNNEHHCNENITDEEYETLAFFKENHNYRKCPNCQSMVVREGGGCNNMTCTNVWCGYEFCWICNKKYDDSHYKNPLSMCFGLGETKTDGKLTKYKRVRFFRCLLIFMLLIFVIFPIVLVFFSVFEASLFIITFVLDGSVMGNIKLKSICTHKFFYKVTYGFYIVISIAYIPLGYLSIALFTIAMPIYCIVNKIRNKNDEDLE